METDITALEEGEKSVDLLVRRDIFNKRDECIPHGHVVGIGFANETNRRLRVNGTV